MSLARTQTALRRWAEALPAAGYDLRIIPEDGGRPVLRRCDAAGLIGSAAWLRHLNAQGGHIYCRPMDDRHVLVDDLCPDALADLEAAHRVAAVIRTSPENHQAWVTISASTVSSDAASAVARHLAMRFGADPGAACAQQLGRLPGFANRKDIHRRRDGSYPWSRLMRAAPAVDPHGDRLVAEAVPHEPRICPPAARNSRALTSATPQAEWAEAARRIGARLPAGTVLDRSRVDLAISRRLLARGGGEARALAVVLAGPRATALPAGLALRYAQRTVRAAAAALGADHRG